MSGWGKELHKSDTRLADIILPEDSIWDDIGISINQERSDSSKKKKKSRYKRQVFKQKAVAEEVSAGENGEVFSQGSLSSGRIEFEVFDPVHMLPTALPQGEVRLALPPYSHDHFSVLENIPPRDDRHKQPRSQSSGEVERLRKLPQDVFDATIQGLSGFERVSLIAERSRQNHNGHENGHERSEKVPIRELGRLMNEQHGYRYEIVDPERQEEFVERMIKNIPGEHSIVKEDVTEIINYLTTQKKLEGIKPLIDRSVSVHIRDNGISTVLNFLRINPGKVTEFELLNPRHKDIRATFVLFDTIEKTPVVAIEGVYTHQQYDKKFRRKFRHPEVY